MRGVGTFLVEHYWPGSTVERFRADAELVRAAAERMSGIRLLHSTLVPDEESAFCVFSAASAAQVQEAYGLAGVGFDRVLDALELQGEVGG